MIEQLRRLFSTATLRESVSYLTLERVLTYLLNREIVFKGKVDLTQADVRGLSSGSSSWDDIKDKPASFPPSSHTHPEKQDTLVSGVNIKTVNTQSLLGSGDITISGGVTSVNTQTGVVVLDADDIDDTATTNKFVTASDLTNLGNLSGVNSGDQDLSGLLPNTHLTDFAHADIAHSNRAALDLVSGTNTGDEDLSGLVPYTGATTNVALGANTISTTSRVITPKVSPASDSTTAFQITKADGSTSVVNVDTTNSRIGIGTTAPISLLSIGNEASFTSGGTGQANPTVRLTMDNIYDSSGNPSVNKWAFYNVVNAWVGGIGMSANDMDMFVGPSGNFRFHSGTTNLDGTGASEKMVIESTGNVGIGTIAPDRKLDILDVTNPQLRLTRTDGSVFTDFQTDSSGYALIDPTGARLRIDGALLSLVLIEANTAGVGSPNAIIAAESNTVFTNEGAAALNYHTLPTAAAGLVYTFYIQDADGIRIVANTGDTIRIDTSVSASAGYAESTTVGSSVTLTAINATEWVATSVIGTWTLT